MSEATNLLNNAATGVRTAGSGVNEEHIVIGADRLITVPESLKKLGVQCDHNIETVTFDCPRYWDEHDMSEMDVFINVKRADGISFSTYCGKGTPDSSDNKLMHFDWLIPLGVTEVSGFLSFLVCIQELAIYDPDDPDSKAEIIRHWNSEICTDCYISPGLEGGKVEPGSGENQTGHILKEIAALKASIGGGGDDSLHARLNVLEEWMRSENYVVMSVNSFSSSVATNEIGTTVSSVTLNWSLSKPAKSIIITYGSNTVTIDDVSKKSHTITGLSLTSSTTFTLTATDDEGKSDSKSTTVSFTNNVYYGVGPYVEASGVDSTFVDSHLIKKLSSSRLSSIDVNPGANQHIYYIQPKSYGTCLFYDEMNFEAGMELAGTTTISSTEYYVYRSQYANLGVIKLTIKQGE